MHYFLVPQFKSTIGCSKNYLKLSEPRNTTRLRLHEASCLVCRGSNGPRDIAFICMVPVHALIASSVNRAKLVICEKAS